VFPDQGADEIGLAHHADQAMYWAKQAGGNRVVLFRAERAGENGDVAPEGREG
jgi:predicted signal transduction protein with EAL and GGDEF domain